MSSSTLASPTLSEKARGKQRATAIGLAEDAAGDGMDEDGQEVDQRPMLPWAFSDCDVDTLVILIAHMLNRLIEHNDQVPVTATSITRFHSRAPPQITVIDYLRRVVKYTHLEKIPLLSLLAYIDLTCRCLPDFTLSSLTVHRFLIAGVCAGSKAQCDVFCTNAYYAKVGGIRTNELNGLEREFLRVTEWGLCCHADLLQNYYTYLIPAHGGYQQAPAPAIDPFQALIPPNPGPDPSSSNAPSTSGRTRSLSEASSSRRPSMASGGRARSSTPGGGSSGGMGPSSGSLAAVSPAGLLQGDVPVLGEVSGAVPIPNSNPDRRRGRPAMVKGMASSVDTNRDIEMGSTSPPSHGSRPASLKSRASLVSTSVSVSPSNAMVASPRLSTGHATAPTSTGASNGKRLKSLVGGMFRRPSAATLEPEPQETEPPLPKPVTPKVRSRIERSVDSLRSVEEEEGRRKRLA